MNKIQPITTLRDTAKIEKELKGSSEPIILTKNGYPRFGRSFTRTI
jgi:hypothetical protein